jgi:hypothetical protein
MELKILNSKNNQKIKNINKKFCLIGYNCLSIILKYNQIELTENQKSFITGRKIQFIIDRYISNNRGYDFKTTDEFKKLIADEKTIEESINTIFSKYEKNSKKIRKTTRININSIQYLNNFQNSLKIDYSYLGKHYQFLIDSSKHTIESLSRISYYNIIEESENLQSKIKTGYFKQNDNYEYPECQCGRIESCSRCGRDYCGKTQSDNCPHNRGY